MNSTLYFIILLSKVLIFYLLTPSFFRAVIAFFIV